jgi:hypothetical protein
MAGTRTCDDSLIPSIAALVTAAEWLVSAAGALLIATALRDVFHTILEPSGAGSLPQAIFRGTWRLARLGGDRGKNLAAPLAIVVTISAWTSMVAVGYGLIYWPHLPEEFYVTEGLRAAIQGNIIDALYVSGVALTTVGFGNVVAEGPMLRLALVIESLVGFALLTASASWILSIYPALQRSRSLAGRISTLLDGGSDPKLIAVDNPQVLAVVLYSIADQIGTTRVDLIQYPSTYFFHASRRDLSPAFALKRLDQALKRKDIPQGAATAAAAARSSIQDLGDTLQTGPFGLTAADAAEALHAYTVDHGR